MLTIKQKTSFNNMLVVDCVGKSGGLALTWKEEMKVEIQNYSQRNINAIVKPANKMPRTFIGFYGHLDIYKQTE